jgi:FkbM family methyltransferase
MMLMRKLLFRILCNSATGKIISLFFNYNIPNIRYGFKKYQTPKKYCNDTVRAMIFWGFYESAEMRLIKKYIFKNIPVIELGASLGIVSSHINQYINIETSYTVVEANPYLIDFIKQNILRHNDNKVNFNIINSAIAYNTLGKIEMAISSNNTESTLIKNNQKNISNSTVINAISLSSIVLEPYTLICDIEGAEIDIFKYDKIGLDKCKNLFIELHNTHFNKKKYSVSDLQNIIVNDLGFNLIERDGNVFYFTK